MGLKTFYKQSPSKTVKNYRKTSSQEWEKLGQKFALEIFQKAANEIPAYKDFLKRNKITPSKIQTIEDFKLVPPVDKKNYITYYPLNQLLWGGKVGNLNMLSSSSGSTGSPFLWPRGEEQEIEGAEFVEPFYKYLFGMDSKSTLYVVSFGMGAWIAGTYMTAVTQLLAKKGYPTMVVTPGLEKELLLRLIKNLSGYFDQVLIIGYPPFVKDILDSGKEFDVDWKKLNTKLMFAAEGFSEQWRDYVLEKIGAKNPLKTTTNIYGTADAAIMGMETPLSILFRRELLKQNKIEEFFGQSRQPTLVQYDPTKRYFEKVDGELLFTANSGLPLIRYNLHDVGDLLTYDEIKEQFASLGIKNLSKELKKYDCLEFDWKLPFLYIFGRSDFTVNFYGLGIFPEHIKYGLEDSNISNFVTGKFNMHTQTDNLHNQELIINIELQKNVSETKELEIAVTNKLVSKLQDLNSEFSKLFKELGSQRSTPKVNLFPYNDPQFKIGAKYKWVDKKAK